VNMHRNKRNQCEWGIFHFYHASEWRLLKWQPYGASYRISTKRSFFFHFDHICERGLPSHPDTLDRGREMTIVPPAFFHLAAPFPFTPLPIPSPSLSPQRRRHQHAVASASTPPPLVPALTGEHGRSARTPARRPGVLGGIPQRHTKVCGSPRRRL
jgi:hypothetical protein